MSLAKREEIRSEMVLVRSREETEALRKAGGERAQRLQITANNCSTSH